MTLTARDYQHKRFRSRGNGESESASGGGSELIQTGVFGSPSAPPAVVSPNSASPSDPSTPSRDSVGTGASEGVLMDGRYMDSRLGTEMHAGVESPVVPRKIRVDNGVHRVPDDELGGEVENRDPVTSSSSMPGSVDPIASADSDELSGNSNPMSAEMKKMIQKHTAPVRSPMNTPNEALFLHKPTANGNIVELGTHGIVDMPSESIRYSLGSGKKAMPDDMRRASEGMMVAAAAQRRKGNKLKAAHSSAFKSEEKRSPKDSRLTSPSNRSRSSSKKGSDFPAFKIFILLLQPKSKIFELIQLIYNPNETTVGNIIEKIPENATEEALGCQEYIGLCRPGDQSVLLDMEILASEGRPGLESAKITLGEILVAIPRGYQGPDVAALSKQILGNPKIVKLLKRSDPLAPKRKRRHRHHRSRRSSSRNSVQVLESHDETDEEQEDVDKRMVQAMAHAEEAAAAANAAIRGGIKRTVSLSEQSMSDVSNEASLDESYSSWSRSFENSFSAQASVCSGASRRAIRRRERQARRILILQRTAAVGFLVMIALYVMDPRGYQSASSNKSRNGMPVVPQVTETPMGLLGIVQCMFLLLTLYKVERFVRTGAQPDGSTIPRRCPFLRASVQAMDSLKNRYAAKLSKKNSMYIGRNGSTDEDSLSKRLRSFSLKAAANVDGDRSIDTDTGSL